MVKQSYRVKRHKGTRSRPMISLTLAAEEVAILEQVAAKRGLTKSGLVGQLLRALVVALVVLDVACGGEASPSPAPLPVDGGCNPPHLVPCSPDGGAELCAVC